MITQLQPIIAGAETAPTMTFFRSGGAIGLAVVDTS